MLYEVITVFRLALKYFPFQRPDLFKELMELGFVAETARITSYNVCYTKLLRRPLERKVFQRKAEYTALACVFLKSSRKPGIEIIQAAQVVGFIPSFAVTAEVNDKIIDLKRDVRNAAVLGHPAGSELCTERVREYVV